MAVRSNIIALIVALAGFSLRGLAATPSQAQETVSVPVGDFYFCSSDFQSDECVTTVEAGDTVVWDFSGATSTHTTTGDGWDSGNLSDGTFSFTFDEAGEFAYRCTIHPTLMMGRVVVEAGADEPVDSGDDEPDDEPGAPADDAGDDPEVVSPPPAGFGPEDGSANGWWMAMSLAAAGLTLAGLGTLAYRRIRR